MQRSSETGFTLVELVVVVLIVAILAAVAMPIMRGRLGSARWSEGKAAMGAIATALRTYAAERREVGSYGPGQPTFAELGFSAGALHGVYFTIANYSIVDSSFTAGADPELTFSIQCTNVGTGIISPTQITLDETGTWVETP
jgi:prepilin-type N-terminal cleavage/methylation domain-containing protein